MLCTYLGATGTVCLDAVCGTLTIHISICYLELAPQAYRPMGIFLCYLSNTVVLFLLAKASVTAFSLIGDPQCGLRMNVIPYRVASSCLVHPYTPYIWHEILELVCIGGHFV